MCSGDLWSHHVTFLANAAYAAQYNTMVAYMIYYVNVLAKQTTVSLYIRQAVTGMSLPLSVHGRWPSFMSCSGSCASWFVGDGDGRSSVGGHRRLWVVNGGG